MNPSEVEVAGSIAAGLGFASEAGVSSAGPASYFAEACETTMDVAREFALAALGRGLEPSRLIGLAFRTNRQTRGRGRQNSRNWSNPTGTALMATSIWPEHGDGLPVSLLAGLALARWLEEAVGLPASLKWPNDLLCQGLKVGGILTETLGEGSKLVLLGTGINLSGRVDAGDRSGSGIPAGTLEEAALLWAARHNAEAPVISGPELLLPPLLGIIAESLSDPNARVAIDLRLAWRGQPVRILNDEGATIFEGVLEGISKSGAARLKLPSGFVEVRSGSMVPA